MVRRVIGTLALCGCVVAAGCGASASASGLTSGFAAEAKAAHDYMKSDVIPAVGTPRFPTVIAASRARVKIVQSKISGDVDEGVWLLLMMVNVKSNELNGAKELAATMTAPSRTVREALREVENERDTCMGEADGWINNTLLKQVLTKGACLAQARQAAAILKR